MVRAIMQIFKRLIAPFFAFVPVLGFAATATFQQGANGYTGEQGTYIDNTVGAANFSSSTQDQVGYGSSEIYRTLLRFDVSSLTGLYSSIDQIQLTLTVPTAVGSTILQLHEVNAANGDWVPTAATWNNKNQSTSTPWNGGTGLGTTGFGSTIVSSASITAPGTVTLTISGAMAASLVSDFNTGNNEGFLINAANEVAGNNYLFISSPMAASGQPILTVSYTPTPEPSSACLLIGSLAMLAARRRSRA